MRSERKGRTIITIVVLSLIFAFVLGVLVYVGGALLQTVNFARIPGPATSFEGVLAGVLLGLIFGLIQRNKMNRES